MKSIRCLLLDIIMVLTTIVMGICAFPIRLFFPHKALGYAKAWCAIMLFYYKKIGRMKIVIEGRENLDPSGGAIIASQHQSGFDTLIWMLLLPKPCYVMKEELTRIPLLGPMLVLSGMMPIKRGAGVKGLKSLLKGTQKAFAEGRQIIIFPQGTRTPPGEKKRLKPGIVAMARQNNVPIYPVATNSGYFWNKDTLYPGKAARQPGVVYVAIAPPLFGKTEKNLLGAIEQSWSHMEHAYQLVNDPDKTQNMPVYEDK